MSIRSPVAALRLQLRISRVCSGAGRRHVRVPAAGLDILSTPLRAGSCALRGSFASRLRTATGELS
jgi:hypothetical protein